MEHFSALRILTKRIVELFETIDGFCVCFMLHFLFVSDDGGSGSSFDERSSCDKFLFLERNK